jgi:beta-galactosidase
MTAARLAPPPTKTVAAGDRLFSTFAYTGDGAGGEEDKLAENILAYTDDALIYLETVPKSLVGARLIRTANKDRSYWANDYIVATAARDLEFFVAHDAAAPRPGWLKNFRLTGDVVKVKGRSLKLYSQPLKAGESIRISGNVDQGKSVGTALNFIIFARPAGAAANKDLPAGKNP